MSHIFNMWGNTLPAPMLISIDICANCQHWWEALWILGGLGHQSRGGEWWICLVVFINGPNDSIEGKQIVSNPAWTGWSSFSASARGLSQELISRHAKETTDWRCLLHVYVGLAPRGLGYPSLLWSLHKPPETEMTKHCRSAIRLL